ncbi:hypothetical protein J4227_04895 [Candidatus Woesearchaeota archaeon]|nr:hypothetical protein [Candidatus Woesearchaeota archaeon]
MINNARNGRRIVLASVVIIVFLCMPLAGMAQGAWRISGVSNYVNNIFGGNSPAPAIPSTGTASGSTSSYSGQMMSAHAQQSYTAGQAAATRAVVETPPAASQQASPASTAPGGFSSMEEANAYYYDANVLTPESTAGTAESPTLSGEMPPIVGTVELSSEDPLAPLEPVPVTPPAAAPVKYNQAPLSSAIRSIITPFIQNLLDPVVKSIGLGGIGLLQSACKDTNEDFTKMGGARVFRTGVGSNPAHYGLLPAVGPYGDIPTLDLNAYFAQMDADSVRLAGRMQQVDDETYNYEIEVRIFPVADSTWDIWLTNSCKSDYVYRLAANAAVQSYTANRKWYLFGIAKQMNDATDAIYCQGKPCRYDTICVQAKSGSSYNNGQERCLNFCSGSGGCGWVTALPGHALGDC